MSNNAMFTQAELPLDVIVKVNAARRQVGTRRVCLMSLPIFAVQ